MLYVIYYILYIMYYVFNNCWSGSLSFSMCLHNPLAWTGLVYFPTAVEGQGQKKLPGTLHNMLLELPGPHTQH